MGDYTAVDTGALGAQAGSLAALGLVSLLLSVIGTYWYQGVVVKVVEDMEDGHQDLSVGKVFSTAAPFVMRLIGAGDSPWPASSLPSGSWSRSSRSLFHRSG